MVGCGDLGVDGREFVETRFDDDTGADLGVGGNAFSGIFLFLNCLNDVRGDGDGLRDMDMRRGYKLSVAILKLFLTRKLQPLANKIKCPDRYQN